MSILKAILRIFKISEYRSSYFQFQQNKVVSININIFKNYIKALHTIILCIELCNKKSKVTNKGFFNC